MKTKGKKSLCNSSYWRRKHRDRRGAGKQHARVFGKTGEREQARYRRPKKGEEYFLERRKVWQTASPIRRLTLRGREKTLQRKEQHSEETHFLRKKVA